MEYKAVMFDLDGTLLDTIDDLADSMNIVLQRYGFPSYNVNDYCNFIGSGLKHLVNMSLPEAVRNEANINKFTEELNDEYRRLWDNKTKIYEGVEELLNELEEKSITKVILSNKPDEFVQVICKKYFSKWDFKYISGSFSDKPRKPNPKMAIEITRKLDIKPEHFVYMGDSGIDMKTANAAGMYAVGCLWGFREADELLKYGAKKLISSPYELLNCFK